MKSSEVRTNVNGKTEGRRDRGREGHSELVFTRESVLFCVILCMLQMAQEHNYTATDVIEKNM